MGTPFTAEIEVRFGDCDLAGIVYFAKLFHYCHVAFEQAWRGALGTPYAELIARERIGFPVVHVETDFRSPARYGDVLAIDVSVERVGTSSVVFRFDARVGERAVFRSTHTTVCMDFGDHTSRPIPDDHRAALEALIP